jgi:hypothetical protein
MLREHKKLPAIESILWLSGCVLVLGLNILQIEDRFWNSRLAPELCALFQNSGDCLRS